MAKKSGQKVAVISPQLQKSLDIINALKTQVDAEGTKLLQVKVMDESTLSVCQQNLSKVNGIVNTIEDKRVELTKPYLEGQRTINALCKSVAELATKAISHAKTEVANWEKARIEKEAKIQAEIDAKAKIEADKVLAEEARKKAITDFISLELTPYLQNSYNALKTVTDCDKLLNYINTKFPGIEKFQEFLADANQIRDNFIGLIESKKAQLSAADNISESELEILKEKERIAVMKQELAAKELEIKQREEQAKAEKERKEAEELAEQQRLQAQAMADADKTRNIRFLWRFEVADKSKIPADWLALDESKVKEYIKANKDTLTEGQVFNGILFRKEISVVA